MLLERISVLVEVDKGAEISAYGYGINGTHLTHLTHQGHASCTESGLLGFMEPDGPKDWSPRGFLEGFSPLFKLVDGEKFFLIRSGGKTLTFTYPLTKTSTLLLLKEGSKAYRLLLSESKRRKKPIEALTIHF